MKDVCYKPWLFLTFVFIISRIILYAAGIEFDNQYVEGIWAYLDIVVLKENLWESVLYLHSQPPLFNLILGSLALLFPENYNAFSHALFVILSYFFMLSLYFTTRELGFSEKISLIVTCLFILNPATMLYENFFIYTLPTAALLCIAAAFLTRAVKKRSILAACIYVWLCTVILFLRSTFQIQWYFIMVLLPVFIFPKEQRKKLVLSCLAPIALVILLYGKNYFIFGQTTTSSWLGMNLAKFTLSQFSSEEIKDLVEKEKISKLTLVGPFHPLADYKKYGWGELRQNTGVLVLDNEVKSGDLHAANLNHAAYIEISNQFKHDAITLIKLYPERWMQGFFSANGIYFYPPSNYFALYTNRNNLIMKNFELYYNKIIYGQIIPYPWEKNFSLQDARDFRMQYVGILFVFLQLVSVIYAAYYCYMSWRKRDVEWVVWVFLLVNTLYVMTISNAVEAGENNRYRFMVEAFNFILFGLVIRDAYNTISRKRSV